MRFAAYTRLNGLCSTLIGVAFIVAGFPGLLGDGSRAANLWLAIPGVLVVVVPIAAVAMRRGVPFAAPGRWLTDRPILRAEAGASVIPADRLRRRLVVETVVWGAVALAVIAGFSTSRPFAYATGWASLAYGLLELLASARRIEAVERERRRTFFVHRRPGFGTPELTYDSGVDSSAAAGSRAVSPLESDGDVAPPADPGSGSSSARIR